MTIQLGQIAPGFEQDTRQCFPQSWDAQKPCLCCVELAGGKG